MLGSLSWPSGSSKLDMVKWIRETKLEKDVQISNFNYNQVLYQADTEILCSISLAAKQGHSFLQIITMSIVPVIIQSRNIIKGNQI
jgi:hypothetical protein